MNKGQTVFSQVIDFLPKKKFRQYVNLPFDFCKYTIPREAQ